MKCPFCGHADTQVKDSRPSEDGAMIRRRRHCPSCDSRFTTTERVQLRELTVIKRGGERRPFDRDKIMRSMQIAARKRPVSHEALEQAVSRIVKTLEVQAESDVEASVIGQLVMEELQKLDQVAYIRYASVYRDFTEIKDFETFMQTMAAQRSQG